MGARNLASEPAAIVVIKESHRRAMNRRLRPASRLRCVFERRCDADFSAVIGIQAAERRSSLAQDTDRLRPRVQSLCWASEWREGSLRPRRIVCEHQSTALDGLDQPPCDLRAYRGAAPASADAPFGL